MQKPAKIFWALNLIKMENTILKAWISLLEGKWQVFRIVAILREKKLMVD